MQAVCQILHAQTYLYRRYRFSESKKQARWTCLHCPTHLLSKISSLDVPECKRNVHSCIVTLAPTEDFASQVSGLRAWCIFCIVTCISAEDSVARTGTYKRTRTEIHQHTVIQIHKIIIYNYTKTQRHRDTLTIIQFCKHTSTIRGIPRSQDPELATHRVERYPLRPRNGRVY